MSTEYHRFILTYVPKSTGCGSYRKRWVIVIDTYLHATPFFIRYFQAVSIFSGHKKRSLKCLKLKVIFDYIFFVLYKKAQDNHINSSKKSTENTVLFLVT